MLAQVLYLITVMTPTAAYAAQMPMTIEVCLAQASEIAKKLPQPSIVRCVPVGKRARFTHETET